jgi:hypothetical protein
VLVDRINLELLEGPSELHRLSLGGREL